MSEIDFTNALINGISLFWLVMALVTLWGKFGATGKVQLASSLGTGLVIGTLYQASLKPLITWVDWFGAIIYGVALGLTATGVYETGKKVLSSEIFK